MLERATDDEVLAIARRNAERWKDALARLAEGSGTEDCHCGEPTAAASDPPMYEALGPAAHALCERCLPLRCDADPGACRQDGATGERIRGVTYVGEEQFIRLMADNSDDGYVANDRLRELAQARRAASATAPVVEFLLARTSENEAVARAAETEEWSTGGGRMWAWDRIAADQNPHGPSEGWVLTEPRYILAECRARRARIAKLADMEADLSNTLSSHAYHLLCLEALPYADHPDYRDEWAARADD